MPAVSMMAPNAYAETETQTLHFPQNKGGVSTWDCVWFGEYKDEDGFAEPIKWRVLSVSNKEAFLLADTTLGEEKSFEPETGAVYAWSQYSWEYSNLRSWLNNEFMKEAFTVKESNAIIEKNVKFKSRENGGKIFEIGTLDYVFLLSEDEIENSFYAFYSEQDLKCGQEWWLRDTVDNHYHGYSYNYTIDDSGVRKNRSIDEEHGIRPALYLNLNSDVWSYAGTVSSNGTTDEVPAEATDDGPVEYVDISKVPYTLKGVNQTGKSGEIEVADNADGKLGGSSTIAKLFKNDMNFRVPMVNFKVMSTNNLDGTYTFYVAIGADEDPTADKNRFKAWKSKIKDAKDNFSKLKALNRQSGEFTSDEFKSSGFSADFYALGFYELTVDEKGNTLKDDGGIILGASGAYTYSQLFMFPPVPFPFYMEFGASVDCYGIIAANNIFTSGKKTGSLSVTILPVIYLGVGAGIPGLASLGIRGYAKFPIQVTKPSKGDFVGEVAFRYSLLFVIDGEYKIAKVTLPVWDNTPKTLMANQFAQSKNVVPKKINYTFADRDYQEKTTKWNGGRKLFATNKLSSSGDSSVTETPLQEYVMPDTIPQINTVSGEKVMVFQVNDSQRTAANASVLKYSVQELGKWSEPAAIKDDGTLDTYADTKVIGDDLYVTWQKCTEEIDDRVPEKAMKTAAEKSEIFVAKYNTLTNSFETPIQITQNEYLDGMPKLVDCNGKPGVVWTRNERNNIVDISGTKQIYGSIFDGTKWSTESKLSEADGTITELTGLYKSDKMTAYYTVSNAEGTEQTLCKNEEGQTKVIERYTQNTASGLNVYDNQVNFIREGNRYAILDNDSIATADAVEENRMGASAKRYKVGDKDAIIWMSNDDNGCAFYSSVKEDDTYSLPVEIYRNEKNTGKKFDAVLNEDGSWDIVYTGQSASDAEKTSLFYVNKKSGKRVKLDSLLASELELSADGQPITYSVTNTGEETVEELNLSAKLDSETVLDKTVNCSIAPGETAVLEDKITTPPKSGTMKVQVSAVGQQDMTENGLEEELLYNNFMVEAVDKKVDSEGEKVTFTAKIKNIGKETHDASVSFYRDANATNSFGEPQTFSNVKPGETREVTFEYKAEDAVINADKDGFPCSIKVDADEDIDETDNLWSGITYLWELHKTVANEIKSENHVHSMKKTEAKEATCKEEGNIEYWTCSGCKKLFADENGNSQITEEDTVLAKTDHTLLHEYATAATDTTEGNHEYWFCQVCGESFGDKEAKEESVIEEPEDLVIPLKGHKFSYDTDGSSDAKLYAYCYENGLCVYCDKPLTLTLTATSDANLVYNGKAKAVTYASGEAAAWKIATEKDAPVIEYYLENGETKTNTTNSKAASEGAAPVNVGKYVAKVTVTDDFDSTVTIEKKFEITKANQPKTTVKMNGYTYEETPSTPSLSEGAKEEPTITYYYSTSSDASGGVKWNNMNGKSLAAGKYYIYAVVADNMNYNGYTTETSEFNVAKANQPQAAVNMDGYKYNGTPSTPSLNEEVKENPDITYYYNTSSEASGGTEWKNINKTSLDAGTYYMYAVVKDNTNYNGYTTQTKQFKVANDDQLAPKTGEGYSLNKSILKITVKDGYEVSSSNENVEKIESGATLSDNAKYYIRKAAKKNYNASAWTSFTTKKLQNEPVELLTAKTSGKRAVKLSWNKVPGATKYVVYGQLCGKRFKKLKTVKGTSYTVKKIKGKKLRAHDTYKFCVVASKGLKKIVTSKTIHFITAGTMSGYSNITSIKAKDSTKTLAVGEKYIVKATVKNYKGKKTVSKAHGSALRYISNNPYVASVNSKGVVTAKREGEAIIYIQSVSGKYCMTEIVVQ